MNIGDAHYKQYKCKKLKGKRVKDKVENCEVFLPQQIIAIPNENCIKNEEVIGNQPHNSTEMYNLLNSDVIVLYNPIATSLSNTQTVNKDPYTTKQQNKPANLSNMQDKCEKPIKHANKRCIPDLESFSPPPQKSFKFHDDSKYRSNNKNFIKFRSEIGIDYVNLVNSRPKTSPNIIIGTTQTAIDKSDIISNKHQKYFRDRHKVNETRNFKPQHKFGTSGYKRNTAKNRPSGISEEQYDLLNGEVTVKYCILNEDNVVPEASNHNDAIKTNKPKIIFKSPLHAEHKSNELLKHKNVKYKSDNTNKCELSEEQKLMLGSDVFVMNGHKTKNLKVNNQIKNSGQIEKLLKLHQFCCKDKLNSLKNSFLSQEISFEGKDLELSIDRRHCPLALRVHRGERGEHEKSKYLPSKTAAPFDNLSHKYKEEYKNQKNERSKVRKKRFRTSRTYPTTAIYDDVKKDEKSFGIFGAKHTNIYNLRLSHYNIFKGVNSYKNAKKEKHHCKSYPNSPKSLNKVFDNNIYFTPKIESHKEELRRNTYDKRDSAIINQKSKSRNHRTKERNRKLNEHDKNKAKHIRPKLKESIDVEEKNINKSKSLNFKRFKENLYNTILNKTAPPHKEYTEVNSPITNKDKHKMRTELKQDATHQSVSEEKKHQACNRETQRLSSNRVKDIMGLNESEHKFYKLSDLRTSKYSKEKLSNKILLQQFGTEKKIGTRHKTANEHYINFENLPYSNVDKNKKAAPKPEVDLLEILPQDGTLKVLALDCQMKANIFEKLQRNKINQIPENMNHQNTKDKEKSAVNLQKCSNDKLYSEKTNTTLEIPYEHFTNIISKMKGNTQDETNNDNKKEYDTVHNKGKSISKNIYPLVQVTPQLSHNEMNTPPQKQLNKDMLNKIKQLSLQLEQFSSTIKTKETEKSSPKYTDKKLSIATTDVSMTSAEQAENKMQCSLRSSSLNEIEIRDVSYNVNLDSHNKIEAFKSYDRRNPDRISALQILQDNNIKNEQKFDIESSLKSLSSPREIYFGKEAVNRKYQLARDDNVNRHHIPNQYKQGLKILGKESPLRANLQNDDDFKVNCLNDEYDSRVCLHNIPKCRENKICSINEYIAKSTGLDKKQKTLDSRSFKRKPDYTFTPVAGTLSIGVQTEPTNTSENSSSESLEKSKIDPLKTNSKIERQVLEAGSNKSLIKSNRQELLKPIFQHYEYTKVPMSALTSVNQSLPAITSDPDQYFNSKKVSQNRSFKAEKALPKRYESLKDLQRAFNVDHDISDSVEKVQPKFLIAESVPYKNHQQRSVMLLQSTVPQTQDPFQNEYSKERIADDPREQGYVTSRLNIQKSKPYKELVKEDETLGTCAKPNTDENNNNTLNQQQTSNITQNEKYLFSYDLMSVGSDVSHKASFDQSESGSIKENSLKTQTENANKINKAIINKDMNSNTKLIREQLEEPILNKISTNSNIILKTADREITPPSFEFQRSLSKSEEDNFLQTYSTKSQSYPDQAQSFRNVPKSNNESLNQLFSKITGEKAHETLTLKKSDQFDMTNISINPEAIKVAELFKDFKISPILNKNPQKMSSVKRLDQPTPVNPSVATNLGAKFFKKSEESPILDENPQKRSSLKRLDQPTPFAFPVNPSVATNLGAEFFTKSEESPILNETPKKNTSLKRLDQPTSFEFPINPSVATNLGAEFFTKSEESPILNETPKKNTSLKRLDQPTSFEFPVNPSNGYIHVSKTKNPSSLTKRPSGVSLKNSSKLAKRQETIANISAPNCSEINTIPKNKTENDGLEAITNGPAESINSTNSELNSFSHILFNISVKDKKNNNINQLLKKRSSTDIKTRLLFKPLSKTDVIPESHTDKQSQAEIKAQHSILRLNQDFGFTDDFIDNKGVNNASLKVGSVILTKCKSDVSTQTTGTSIKTTIEMLKNYIKDSEVIKKREREHSTNNLTQTNKRTKHPKKSKFGRINNLFLVNYITNIPIVNIIKKLKCAGKKDKSKTASSSLDFKYYYEILAVCLEKRGSFNELKKFITPDPQFDRSKQPARIENPYNRKVFVCHQHREGSIHAENQYIKEISLSVNTFYCGSDFENLVNKTETDKYISFVNSDQTKCCVGTTLESNSRRVQAYSVFERVRRRKQNIPLKMLKVILLLEDLFSVSYGNKSSFVCYCVDSNCTPLIKK